jgi:hypothetical protein
MLIAHDSKLTNDLTAHDSKIANEINAHVSKINNTFTAEIRENNASFTKELTAVIENFNARNNSFSSEVNGFLASLNTITNKLSEAEKLWNYIIIIFVEFHPNLHQSKLLLKFFKMIWPNVMRLSEEPISINKVCPMNLKLMNLNWKVR